MPADPPELGGALASGGLAEGTGLHRHSQGPSLTRAATPATPTRCMAGARCFPPLAAGLWFHCIHQTHCSAQEGTNFDTAPSWKAVIANVTFGTAITVSAVVMILLSLLLMAVLAALKPEDLLMLN